MDGKAGLRIANSNQNDILNTVSVQNSVISKSCKKVIVKLEVENCDHVCRKV